MHDLFYSFMFIPGILFFFFLLCNMSVFLLIYYPTKERLKLSSEAQTNQIINIKVRRGVSGIAGAFEHKGILSFRKCTGLGD